MLSKQDKQTKIIYNEIAKSFRKDNLYLLEDNIKKLYDYIVVDVNDTTKYICGNFYMVIVNIDDVVQKYYTFNSPVYTAYGLAERYKVLTGLIKIDDVCVYNIKDYYTSMKTWRPTNIDLKINNKCLTCNEAKETLDELGYLNSFKKKMANYFDLKIRYHIVEDYHRLNNIYFNAFDLKRIVNQSKKLNFQNVAVNQVVVV